jgi:hypothetical protein
VEDSALLRRGNNAEDEENVDAYFMYNNESRGMNGLPGEIEIQECRGCRKNIEVRILIVCQTNVQEFTAPEDGMTAAKRRHVLFRNCKFLVYLLFC